MAISKVVYKSSANATPVVWMDATPATASASNIISPYTAMLANGIVTQGTGSGGGGGLEYETGTWTPASDVADTTISFTNTHTTAPFYYEIVDITGTYYNTTNSNWRVQYANFGQFFGSGIFPSTSSTWYGRVNCIYRTSNASNLGGYTIDITHPASETGSSDTTYPRYWATNTTIRAYSISTSRYWRSGRTYKWVAIWAPST